MVSVTRPNAASPGQTHKSGGSGRSGGTGGSGPSPPSGSVNQINGGNGAGEGYEDYEEDDEGAHDTITSLAGAKMLQANQSIKYSSPFFIINFFQFSSQIFQARLGQHFRSFAGHGTMTIKLYVEF